MVEKKTVKKPDFIGFCVKKAVLTAHLYIYVKTLSAKFRVFPFLICCLFYVGFNVGRNSEVTEQLHI